MFTSNWLTEFFLNSVACSVLSLKSRGKQSDECRRIFLLSQYKCKPVVYCYFCIFIFVFKLSLQCCCCMLTCLSPLYTDVAVVCLLIYTFFILMLLLLAVACFFFLYTHVFSLIMVFEVTCSVFCFLENSFAITLLFV